MRLLLICVFIILISVVKAQKPSLMPLPEKVVFSDSKFRINGDVKILIRGQAHERLFKEASRFNKRLSERTGVFFKTWQVDSNFFTGNENLIIQSEKKGVVQLEMDESYKLSVSEKKIHIQAVSDIGAIRALETLLQLIQIDKEGHYFSGVEIADRPRFAWRGLLISQPYHFMPMHVIKRTLDAMAMVKMNVLHYYISDDQAYSIESKKFPDLHKKASNEEYFTHEQIREMIDYADQRGIRVVPELDLPGHSTAILSVFPELAAIKRNYELQTHWGVFDPVMDPTKKETFIFLDTLLTEVASLFPDNYFHIGGDENNGKDWAKNDSIQRFMKLNGFNSTVALQNYFNQKVQSILKRSNKHIIGWDEILMKELDQAQAKQFFEQEKYDELVQLTVPKDIIIQSWRGMEALLSAAKNGYKSILSKGYYIDLMQPTWYHYLNDPVPNNNTLIIPDSEANFDRFESSIIDKIKKGVKLLTPNEERSIIGGEATMWTEHVTEETIDSRIWPRTAAIAERLWSPASLRDIDDMYKRLDNISLQLEWIGSTHLKNSPMILRRLAGNEKITSLEKVIGFLEPVKGYQRNQADNFTKYSPYTQLVDITIADPKELRQFNKLIEHYLLKNNAEDNQKISAVLEGWRENHKQVTVLAKDNPLLGDLVFHSTSMDMIAELALKYLQNKNNISFDSNQLKTQFNQLTEKRSIAKGYCELMVWDAIKKLIVH